MIMHDSRISVVFGPLEAAEPGDAVLFEGEVQPFAGASVGFLPSARHAAGCACCTGRSAAGRALGSLLHARARNEVPFFTRVLVVVATDTGRADVATALLSDPIASGCFKPGEKSH
jgi:hypothetical protein